MSKITAIFQVRLGSSRLPGKVLMDIHGQTLLAHVLERVQRSSYINQIILATTEKPDDEKIIAFTEEHNLLSFRGSETDVLDRFYRCARDYGAENIVRITPDDPFKDHEIIDRAIEIYLEAAGEIDYVTNTLPPSYPLGLDIEVFSIVALEEAWSKAEDPYEREHVTPYIWRRPEQFKIKNFSYKEDLSHWRWTLDNEKDLLFAREVYKRIYKEKADFLFDDLLELLKREPHLADINKG